MVRKVTKYHLLIPFLRDYTRHVILADMERELEIPHQTLVKYASELVKDGILFEERKPKNVIYRMNWENHMVLNYISSAEKAVLEDHLAKSSLLKRLYEKLSPFMLSTDFLVFGSFARDLGGGDIDLLAAGAGSGLKDVTSRFGETYGKKIHLIMPEKIPANEAMMRELMEKHIILSGFDMFVKSFWLFTWKK